MKKYTKQDVVAIYERLKFFSNKTLNKRQWLKSLNYIEAAANWAYNFNWIYYDEGLENLVKKIAEKTQEIAIISNPLCDRTVIIDSFCLDNRGLTLQYIRALKNNKEKILYICTSDIINIQCDILQEIKAYSNSSLLLFNEKKINQIEKSQIIVNSILQFSPSRIFLHLNPWDTSALMACHLIKGANKYFINLTDHAFWMGASFIDYCFEFRPYGITVSLEKRDLKESQLLVLPYYPITPLSDDFNGFPELPRDIVKVFAGGALYKMLGGNNVFFRLMDMVLDISPIVYVLVAGFKPDRQFDLGKAIMKNKDRVVEIGIRSDINAVFDNIDISLSTYPTIGGLMNQYAAAHGKPILSYHEKGDEESKVEELINHFQNSFKSFSDFEEFKAYADKLINDEQYRLKEGQLLKNGMMTEDSFSKELISLISSHNNIRSLQKDIINYDSFFERYLELENNNGYLASQELAAKLKFCIMTVCKGYYLCMFEALIAVLLKKMKSKF